MKKIVDCVVIIRSIGERTERLCTEILQKQVSDPESIMILRNFSYNDAIVKSMALAIESNKKYAIFHDADFLLRGDAISIMVSEAEKLTSPFFMYKFGVLDFQFGCPIYGIPIYNSEYFALAQLYQSESKSVQRSESYMYYQLSTKHNIPSIGSDKIVGLHGYEQWFADSYRTMFVRGVKFHHRFDYVFQRLYKISLDDPNNLENKILLKALLDGTYYRFTHDVAPIDKRYYDPYFEKAKRLLNFQEKEPINQRYIDPGDEIDRYQPDLATLEIARSYLPVGILEPKPPSYKQQPKLKDKIRKNLAKFYQLQRSAFYTLFKDY